MCCFGISITLIFSNCVIKDHTYVETNLESKRSLSCRFPVHNYNVSKKVNTRSQADSNRSASSTNKALYFH